MAEDPLLSPKNIYRTTLSRPIDCKSTMHTPQSSKWIKVHWDKQ